jgi:hypothetical protein
MGGFELNEVEKENQKTLVDSIKVLYGDDIDYEVQYLISHTGIGLYVEIIITSTKKVLLPNVGLTYTRSGEVLRICVKLNLKI